MIQAFGIRAPWLVDDCPTYDHVPPNIENLNHHPLDNAESLRFKYPPIFLQKFIMLLSNLSMYRNIKKGGDAIRIKMKELQVIVGGDLLTKEEFLKEKIEKLKFLSNEYQKLFVNFVENDNDIQSAVLIPLYLNKDDDLEVLLTVRNGNISLYGGEVSLPGGKKEDRDNNIITTALRETEEELGIKCNKIKVIETLKPVPVNRRKQCFIVQPVLGILSSPFSVIMEKDEVIDIITIKLESFIKESTFDQEKQYPYLIGYGRSGNNPFIIRGFTFYLLFTIAFVFFKDVSSKSNILNMLTDWQAIYDVEKSNFSKL